MKLPSAIVIGAPKAGTTTLCAALARHPYIYMCPGKETHYFNLNYEKKDLNWYASLFRGAAPDQISMEGTPDYAVSNHVDVAMKRMAQHIPKAKLIYIVRDPIDRLESHYVQSLSNHRQVVPIDEAMEKWPAIVDTSRYWDILDSIKVHFPSNQILVLFLDDYRTDKRKVHARVLDFLGVDGSQESLDIIGAQDQLHTRAGQGIDGSFLALLRRSKHYQTLHDLMPSAIIKWGKSALRKPLKVEAKLNATQLAALRSEFDEKWAAFQDEHKAPSETQNEQLTALH